MSDVEEYAKISDSGSIKVFQGEAEKNSVYFLVTITYVWVYSESQ